MRRRCLRRMLTLMVKLVLVGPLCFPRFGVVSWAKRVLHCLHGITKRALQNFDGCLLHAILDIFTACGARANGCPGSSARRAHGAGPCSDQATPTASTIRRRRRLSLLFRLEPLLKQHARKNLQVACHPSGFRCAYGRLGRAKFDRGAKKMASGPVTGRPRPLVCGS